ncbi:MAG: MmgE/PrpD family protein [Sandarakinorhabdus sp.]|nr:MmgE/PrpD family protein [Sandarakinorhabdus sp.]
MSAVAALIDYAGVAHRLPDDVAAVARHFLADTLAVGAAGHDAPGAAAMLAVARAMGQGTEARLLGTAERMPAQAAAFVNGYRIHCLEWDAVHEPAVVHAMSVVTAALGAAIDRRGGVPADDALVALAVGVEVAAGLGDAATSPLRFFRPATAGLLGAALAVARIDGAPLLPALGLAYSSVAGTMQAHVEGSLALPFQIANAARAAVLASDLAKAGFPAPADVLDGPFGYFNLIDAGDSGALVADLGQRWRIAELSVKPYPSGRASHAALGVLAEFAGQDVVAVELACPPLIRRLVGRAMEPGMTPSWARLCLPFLAGLMRRDGRIDPRCFTPAQFADPALSDFARHLRLVDDGNPDPNALFPQAITLSFADGHTVTRAIPATLGSPDAPLSPAQTKAKLALARELASPAADPRIFTDPLAYFTDPT